MQSHRSSDYSDEQRRYALRERFTNHRLHRNNAYTSSSRGDNQSHHIDDKMTEKWAAFYPNENVAVVTSTSKPPLPPNGKKKTLTLRAFALRHTCRLTDVFSRIRAAEGRPRASEQQHE